MPSNCCVQYCKNYNKRLSESNIKFYRFPVARYKVEQRKKWIAAIGRKNNDGTPWEPKPHELICSQHFVNNEKSNNMFSPNYVPSIFPKKDGTLVRRIKKFVKKKACDTPNSPSDLNEKKQKLTEDPINDKNLNSSQDIQNQSDDSCINQNNKSDIVTKKFKLVMKKMRPSITDISATIETETQAEVTKDATNQTEKIKENSTPSSAQSPKCVKIISKVCKRKQVISKTYFNKKCQMYTFADKNAAEEKTFICNQFIYVGNDCCDVAIQTDIYPNKNKLKVNDAKGLTNQLGPQDKVKVIVTGSIKPELLANLSSSLKKR